MSTKKKLRKDAKNPRRDKGHDKDLKIEEDRNIKDKEQAERKKHEKQDTKKKEIYRGILKKFLTDTSLYNRRSA